MVEGDGLENRYPCKGIVGSNPTLSVIYDFLKVEDLCESVKVSI